ncbi:lamin tail domain-containing protein, partial [Agromyces soli]
AASALALAASPAAAPAAVAAEPGAPAAPVVVVNEILYDDLGGAADAIELFNASAAPVDVSGWSVQDDDRDAAKTGTVPAQTVIAPGGYLVLTKDATPGFPFGLGKGDAVFLFGAGGVTHADLVDSYAYAAGAPLGDWSRCADGGEWAHATAVTLGAANDCTPVVVPGEPGSVVLSEIDSGPADWVELINPGDEAIDLSGYELRDNSDDHRWFFAAGTELAAGARLVVEASTAGVDANGAPLAFQDAIGIGGADSIRLLTPSAELVDSYAWTNHPAIDGSEAAASWARCPDGTGPWSLARVTPGAANDCVLPKIAISEVESNGDAADWVEIVNTGTDPVDLAGWTVMDNDPVGHAADVTPVPAGTVLAPGSYFVFDGGVHFGFGLGANDVAAVRNAAGATVAEYAWTTHAVGTWARCGDVFVDAPVATKGAANGCDDGGETPGEGDAEAWPGAAEVTVIDQTAMFLEDSSGLDAQATADGVFLWAVDNGTGTFWKLRVAADGSASFAPGWEEGKRARFQRDAGNPAAKGPDTEGITVDADGTVYLASERDNGNKGVNQNTVLAVDPDAPGPDVVASQEWDLTASLPQVAANTGIEAVEWVSDASLQGRLVDQNTGSGYDPADYPGHGDGLFFVALEDNGFAYAYALGADGSIDQVAAIDPGMGGAMALDYDTVLGELWVVCDNGCDGRAARIAFTGGEPVIRHFARPAGMPNTNNEGFATAPAVLSTPVADASAAVAPAARASAAPAALAAEASLAAATTVRPAWWFEDGVAAGALRAGTLPGAVDDGEPGGEPGGQPGGGTGGSDGSGSGSAPAVGSGTSGLAETGVDAGLLALAPLGLLAAAAGAVLVLAARRRRSA